jgi:hypothetical protein
LISPRGPEISEPPSHDHRQSRQLLRAGRAHASNPPGCCPTRRTHQRPPLPI